MLSNFALHGYSFGGSAHGVVPAFFFRCPGRPRVGWRRHEPAPETSSLETVSSSGESANFRFRSRCRDVLVRPTSGNRYGLMFAASPAAAAIYSLIESAKLNDRTTILCDKCVP